MTMSAPPASAVAKSPAQAAFTAYIVPRTAAHVRDLGIVLAAVVAAFAIWHALTLLEERFEHKRLQSKETAATPALFRVKRALTAATRKHFSYRTLTLPLGPLSTSITFTELALLLAYLLTMLLLTFTQAHRAPSPGPGKRAGYGWSSRAGWMALASYPWLVVLSMKHNPIAWITGASYERLQVLHRGCSRVTLLVMLMHVGTKVWQNNTFTIAWRVWGLVGAVLGISIFALGNRLVMRAAYQLFVHAHVVLVAALFVATWRHVVDMKDTNKEFKPYLIAAIVFWILDRVLRLISLIYFNGLLPFNKCRNTPVPASMTVYNDCLLQLTVTKPDLPHWEPGAHVFLMSPPASRAKGGVSLALESHPFTIMSLPVPRSQDIAVEKNDNSEAGKLTFLIRPQRGFTRRLFEQAKRGTTADLLVSTAPLSPPRLQPVISTCDTIVLAAAGVGVSWTTPLLLATMRAAVAQQIRVRRLVFLWVVQSKDEIKVLSEQVGEALKLATGTAGRVKLEVRIHVTREEATQADVPAEWAAIAAESNGEKDLPTPESEKPIPSASSSPITVAQSRPDMEILLLSTAGEAQGRLWVGVCGPGAFAQDVKRAARRLIRPMDVLRGDGDGKGDVSVHAEVFGW